MFRWLHSLVFWCSFYKLFLSDNSENFNCDGVDNEAFDCSQLVTDHESSTINLNHPPATNQLKITIVRSLEKFANQILIVCEDAEVNVAVFNKSINSNRLALQSIDFKWVNCPFPQQSFLAFVETILNINISGNWAAVEVSHDSETLKRVHLEGIVTHWLSIKNVPLYESNVFDDIKVHGRIELVNFLSTAKIFKFQNYVEILVLIDTEIENLNADFFQGLSKVERIEMLNVTIKHANADAFDQLSKLKALEIQSSNVTFTSPEMFTKNDELTNIEIMRNREFNMKNALLGNVRNLRNVNLHDNKLKTLPESTFNLSTFIQTIDLSNNLLETLSDKIFENLVVLRSILLRRNSFKEIGYLTTIASSDFRYVYRMNNFLEVDLSFNKIEKLNVKYIVGTRAFANYHLVLLNVENNVIRTIDMKNIDYDLDYKSSSFGDKMTIRWKNNQIECGCMNYDFLYFLQFKTNNDFLSINFRNQKKRARKSRLRM